MIISETEKSLHLTDQDHYCEQQQHCGALFYLGQNNIMADIIAHQHLMHKTLEGSKHTSADLSACGLSECHDTGLKRKAVENKMEGKVILHQFLNLVTSKNI